VHGTAVHVARGMLMSIPHILTHITALEKNVAISASYIITGGSRNRVTGTMTALTGSDMREFTCVTMFALFRISHCISAPSIRQPSSWLVCMSRPLCATAAASAAAAVAAASGFLGCASNNACKLNATNS
jgi:hypothetical protein